MLAILYAMGWAAIFAVVFAILSVIRSEDHAPVAAIVFVGCFLTITILNACLFYWQLPALTFAGGIHIVFFDLILTVLFTAGADAATEGVGAGAPTAAVLLILTSIVWIIGHNSGHSAAKATHIVSVSVEPKADLPASSTSNLVVLSPDIATTKAKQAMSTGIAGQRNYNTYLNLGTATLQYVDGHMVYVFPLHFDGSGNKHRLHNIEPGYVMVSAEDPNAAPVEQYDGLYNMKICQDCGQQSEPTRYAYLHGYSKYVIDDPTLEIDDQGHPYWTAALLTPHLGWTFNAPSKVLLIDAHTGSMQTYDLGKEPSWVDRVYSQGIASQIIGWYGQYQAGFPGLNSTNAGRFKVSQDPILVYTGDGHPEWRALLTSYNADTSTSKIVIMDAETGAMRVYTPQQPMGIEEPIIQAFNNASGEGATNVRSSGYHAVGLTLHVIYGHLTWMATFEPSGTHPSFIGVGFLDAYSSNANNAVFGNSREAALQNYMTQLAAEGSSNGNAPVAGAQTTTITGKVSQVSWDFTSGTKLWYITLAGDPTHVYQGKASAVGPAILFAQPGDAVTMTIQDFGTQQSTRTMSSFTDTRLPLQKAGS
jgi:hypothetical protein